MSLSFEDNFFDSCVEDNCTQCNSNGDRDLIFLKIHRVLKPGGKFCGILVFDRSVDFLGEENIDKQVFDF
jgi:ubiquinone/menaquinone biosynthesis C-methylase UbiE